MPSKDRAVGVDAEADVDFDDSPRETRTKIKSEKKDKDRDRDKDSERKRERRKERERDRDRDRDQGRERDKESSLSTHRPHLKSSRSSKSKPTDSETHSHSHRRHRTKTKEREGTKESRGDHPESPSMANLVPELSRTHLSSTERVSIPYPTFSKAHSKEYVQSKEDVSLRTGRGTDPLTPEPTDLGASEMRRTKSADSPSRKGSSSQKKSSRKDARPPTPPDTDCLAPKDRDDAAEPRPRSRGSYASRSTAKENKSRVSKVSSQATFVKSPGIKPPYYETSRDTANDRSRSTTPRSPATDIPPRHGSVDQSRRPTSIEVTDFSPESAPDSSPKTPTQTTQFPPPPLLPNEKQPPNIRFDGAESNEPIPSQTPANDFPSRPPPPPPPPPLNIQEVPRVDYLLQNGGLPQPIPRQFLAALPRPNGNRPSNPPLRGTETLFAPFFNLLEQYQTVLSSSGSIAVATGHRTIARRLLDRLENVFSRDLPPDGCSCVVCDHAGELHRGLGWGEVLERVSGRTDLPQWPPFDLASMAGKATEEIADLPARPASPVKMDPDIAEEFRDHYLRQSKRVRSAVDKWMSSVAESPAPPPQEVDDETLSFAILTSLEQEDRPYFNALLMGSRDVQPTVRAPTPQRRPRNDFVIRSGLALQRLYRLPQAPRDAETAVYLVKNPHMHDLLRTITDINTSEWEILTSGRFDGFLWSGADNDDAITPTADGPSRGVTPASSGFFPPQRATMSPAGMARHNTPGVGSMGGSRTTTPFGPYSRGATPASFISMSSAASSSYPSRHAVFNDEETELAALAEVEREIFAGMEALEDAFELLHRRAEGVRTALRQRGAGLQISLQQRRGYVASGIDVLPSSGGSAGYERPAWAAAGGGGGGGDEESTVAESESDWGGDDVELAPDDSASNISSSRHRRPKRRNERRTPAPIEEEDE